MSGHSKWAKVKYQKAVKDPKKSRAFSKIANLIAVAARNGSDIEANPKLRLAIDKAKDVGMPKENIEKAIARGAGAGESGSLEEVLIGAYGPGGVALLIQAVTDNKNRTIGEIRHLLTEKGGKMADSESVKWLFQESGKITVPKKYWNDDLSLISIENGANNIQENSEEVIIFCSLENLNKLKKTLLEKIPSEEVQDEIDYLASQSVKITDDNTLSKLNEIFESLDEHNDVEEIYSNLAE